MEAHNTDIDKEIEDFNLKVGVHLINILDAGINQIERGILSSKRGLQDGFYVSIPHYVQDSLVFALNRLYLNPNKKGELITYRGFNVIHGYEHNKVVFYHKDFPMMGVKPIVINIEQEHQTAKNLRN